MGLNVQYFSSRRIPYDEERQEYMTAGKYLDDLFFVGPLLHRVFREVSKA